MNELAELKTRYPAAVQHILHSAQHQRFAQSYLLVGDDMQDLLHFALGLAQLNLCEHQMESGACGQCLTCQQLSRQSYSELRILRPQSKSRSILIESLNELMHFLEMTVSAEKKKIGIIVDAETMNVTTQNAFLKTLEEPDARTLLILCTTRPRLLLPTIKSRCCLLSLRHNRRDYSDFCERGLFRLLSKLEPHCSTLTALSVAAELKQQLVLLENEKVPEEFCTDTQREKWNETEISAAMKKRLKDQDEAEKKSYYLKRREDFISAVQTWFYQLELIANGIGIEQLPHREIFPETFEVSSVPESLYFVKIRRIIDKLSLCFSTNANETLAIETCCLEFSVIPEL